MLVAHEMLRDRISHANRDYEVRNDLDTCAEILRKGDLANVVNENTGGLD